MFDRNLMKLPGMPAVMGALVVLALMQTAAVFGQVHFLAGAVTMLWEGAALDRALPDIACFFACFALLSLLRFGQETMLDRFSAARAEALRDELLGATFDERALLAVRQGTARVATMLGSGIDEVQTYVRIIPPKVVGMAAISIPLLVSVFAIDWVSGVILAVMFPVIIFFMILLGKQAAARAERQYGAYTRLSNRFVDTLRGLPVLRAFGAAEAEGRTMYSYSERLRAATVRTLTTATLSSAVLDLCATFGVAAVAVMLAFRLMDGSMQLLGALTALMLAPEYFAPIRSFASDFHASLDGKNALADALGLLAASKGNGRDSDAAAGDNAGEGEGEGEGQVEGKGKGKGVTGSEGEGEGENPVKCVTGSESAATGKGEGPAGEIEPSQTPVPLRAWCESSTIAFEGVSYRYEGADAPVGPFTFGAQGACRVALVGKSGAGKSTLAGIVAGMLKPGEGRVLVDGIPADLTDAAWKDQVRIIPQHPYLFRASLADNVRFYAPDATDDEVASAVSAVGLDSLVSELPCGLQTPVGEGARGLSGGQAHRVALARILLDRRARVLVFDEPTAHLDIQTELELKPAMLEAMRGKLVFFATHRMHWTRDLDMVVNLTSGDVTGIEACKHPGNDALAVTSARTCTPNGAYAQAVEAQPAAALSAQTAAVGGQAEERPMDKASAKPPAREANPAQPAREANPAQASEAPLTGEALLADDDNVNAAGRGSSARTRTAPPQWFTRFVGRYKRSVAMALALGLVASGFSALLMFASGFLISATAQPGITLFAIMVPVAFVQVFGLGRPIARYLERLVSHDWVLKVTSDLRLMLYSAIERRIEDPALARATGEYLGLLDDDIAHLQNLYLRVAFPAATAILLGIGACVGLAFFSAKLVALMIAVLAICALAIPYAALTSAGAKSRAAKALRAQEYPALTDDVAGSRDWVFAKRGEQAVLAHAARDSAIRAAEAAARLIERAFTLVSALCLGVAVCAIVCWSGNNLAGTASANWIAALALGFFPLMDAFTALPHSLAQVTVHEDAIARLDEYLSQPACEPAHAAQSDSQCGATETKTAEPPTDALADGMHVVSSNAMAPAAPATPSASIPAISPSVKAPAAPAGASSPEDSREQALSDTPAVAFADVTYTYPGSARPAVTGVSLEIPAGQSVAIIGRSGSGKSTLCHIARGILKPQHGTVSVRQAPAPASLAAAGSAGTAPPRPGDIAIGYLGQTPYLFNRTLRENLTLGVLNCDDKTLTAALQAVGLGQKLTGLRDGLGTIIGETGVGVSGGEAHRIALARALVADTPIVLVDEPFSALDPETEESLLDTLFDICADKTLIVVTHHLANIERFDRIIWIEDGCVACDGSPAQLTAESPLFAALLALDRA